MSSRDHSSKGHGDSHSTKGHGGDKKHKKPDKTKPVKVPVPLGCKPGQKIKLSVYGQKLTAYIPDDKREGDIFRIMPPHVDDHEHESEKKNVTVTVPNGVQPGEMLTFTVGEGNKQKKLTVLVPKGKKGGDSMTMTMYSDYDKPKEGGSKSGGGKDKSRSGGKDKSRSGGRDY